MNIVERVLCSIGGHTFTLEPVLANIDSKEPWDEPVNPKSLDTWGTSIAIRMCVFCGKLDIRKSKVKYIKTDPATGKPWRVSVVTPPN